MRKKLTIFCLAILCFTVGIFASFTKLQKEEIGYILEHEKDIAVSEPGTHKGGGNSTGYRFFKAATDSKLQFTKRILHPGSAIGYHLQQEEEIYYIAAGMGEMSMNGDTFFVTTGDAILTLPDSRHGLKQIGNEDLVVIINYNK